MLALCTPALASIRQDIKYLPQNFPQFAHLVSQTSLACKISHPTFKIHAVRKMLRLQLWGLRNIKVERIEHAGAEVGQAQPHPGLCPILLLYAFVIYCI